MLTRNAGRAMMPLKMNTVLAPDQVCFSEQHGQYRHERITMQQVAATYRNVGSLNLFVLTEMFDFRTHACSNEQFYGQ